MTNSAKTAPPPPWIPDELRALSGTWARTNMAAYVLDDPEDTEENLQGAIEALDALLSAAQEIKTPPIEDLPEGILNRWSRVTHELTSSIPTWSEVDLDVFAKSLEQNQEGPADPERVERYARAWTRHMVGRRIVTIAIWLSRFLKDAGAQHREAFLRVLRSRWREVSPFLAEKIFFTLWAGMRDEAREVLEEARRDPAASPELRKRLEWYLDNLGDR